MQVPSPQSDEHVLTAFQAPQAVIQRVVLPFRLGVLQNSSIQATIAPSAGAGAILDPFVEEMIAVDMDGLGALITALDKRMTERFDEVGLRLGNIESKVQDIDVRLAKVESTLPHLATKWWTGFLVVGAMLAGVGGVYGLLKFMLPLFGHS